MEIFHGFDQQHSLKLFRHGRDRVVHPLRTVQVINSQRRGGFTPDKLRKSSRDVLDSAQSINPNVLGNETLRPSVSRSSETLVPLTEQTVRGAAERANQRVSGRPTETWNKVLTLECHLQTVRRNGSHLSSPLLSSSASS